MKSVIPTIKFSNDVKKGATKATVNLGGDRNDDTKYARFIRSALLAENKKLNSCPKPLVPSFSDQCKLSAEKTPQLGAISGAFIGAFLGPFICTDNSESQFNQAATTVGFSATLACLGYMAGTAVAPSAVAISNYILNQKISHDSRLEALETLVAEHPEWGKEMDEGDAVGYLWHLLNDNLTPEQEKDHIRFYLDVFYKLD